NLPQLVAKIFQRKAVASQHLGGKFVGLLLVDLRFGFFDERENVAQAKNARHYAVRMKRLKRIVFFANANELDRLTSDLPNGERRAAASVAIHLGKDDAGKRELLMEFIRRVDGVLPGHRIGDKQNLLRIEQPLERLHLLHELVVDVETSSSIHNQNVAPGVDRLASRLLGKPFDGSRIRLADLAFIKVGLDRRRDHLELLASSRTINVNRDQQRTVSAILKPVGKLARGSGFAGALQPGHEHDGWRLRGKLQFSRIFAESRDQLVADDLDNLLARRERSQHFLPDSLSLNAVDEFFDNFEVDVGFKHRQTNLFQRLGNVLFRKDGLSAKRLKGALKFFLEILEHRAIAYLISRSEPILPIP